MLRKTEPVTATFSDAALAVLDAMPVDPNTTYCYAGGFVCSDDFPEVLTPEWEIVSRKYLYRHLVHFRRRITLGESELHSLPLWRQVVDRDPNWPGLLPERRTGKIVKRMRAAERRAERGHDKLLTEWEDDHGASSG